MARKSRFLILADVALFCDYLFRLASACRFGHVGAIVNSSCMMALVAAAFFAYLFTLPFFAAHFYRLLGVCILADLVVMGLLHPHIFTWAYLSAHCCIACFYLGLPGCMRKIRGAKKH